MESSDHKRHVAQFATYTSCKECMEALSEAERGRLRTILDIRYVTWVSRILLMDPAIPVTPQRPWPW